VGFSDSREVAGRAGLGTYHIPLLWNEYTIGSFILLKSNLILL